MMQCLEAFGCAILFAMLLACREEAQLDGQICHGEGVDHQWIHIKAMLTESCMEKAATPQGQEVIIAQVIPAS